MKQIFKTLSLNNSITPSIIKGLYWLVVGILALLILISSLSVYKKLLFLIIMLLPARILVECVLVVFQLLESQRKTNDILNKIERKLG